jgi:hypothetical protein
MPSGHLISSTRPSRRRLRLPDGRLARQALRFETGDEILHRRRLSYLGQAESARHPGTDFVRSFTPVREGDGAMTLSQAPSVWTKHERDVGISGLPQAEQSPEQDLARSRVRKVSTPHNFAYPLRGIIDHDGELIRGRAIITAHDEVIHRLLEAPEQTIFEDYPDILRTDAKRRRSSGGLEFRALGRRQVPAGAGILVCGGDAVRRGCSGPDLRTRAVAGVEQPTGIEPPYSLPVKLHPLRLAQDGPVPVESEATEIRELRLLDSGPYPRAVQVFHPHEEPRPRRTREQPCQHGRTQVAEMERSGRARREASIGVRDAGLAMYLVLSRLTSQSEPESTT